MSKTAAVKLIYIMGLARSGSTILEIMLANAEKAFGAGELAKLIEDAFIENKSCTCDKNSKDCSVWGNVYKKLNLIGLKEKSKLLNDFDWHIGFFEQIFGFKSKSKFKKYCELNEEILIKIKEVTECPIIIDSSKLPGRAIALRKIPNIDMSVICLTRSPFGLMSSFQKKNENEQLSKSVISTFLYYFISLIMLRISNFLLGNRVIEIKYEDLVLNPENTLTEIGKNCGINLDSCQEKIRSNLTFFPGHIVTGNRLRKQKRIVFNRSFQNNYKVRDFKSLTILMMDFWKWLLRF